MASTRLPALRRSVVVAFALFALLIGSFQPAAQACVIQYVDFDEVLDLLQGSPSAEWEDAVVVGVFEMAVLKAWEETTTHRAASAAALRRHWGEVPGEVVAIHGGQPKVPDTTTDCPLTEYARPEGRTWWQVVFAGTAGRPLRGINLMREGAEVRTVAAADVAILTEALGPSQITEPPILSDTHPSEPAVVASTTIPAESAGSRAAPQDGGNDSTPWSLAVLLAASVAIAGGYWRSRRRSGRERPS